jgi:hypothetical protein
MFDNLMFDNLMFDYLCKALPRRRSSWVTVWRKLGD